MDNYMMDHQCYKFHSSLVVIGSVCVGWSPALELLELMNGSNYMTTVHESPFIRPIFKHGHIACG